MSQADLVQPSYIELQRQLEEANKAYADLTYRHVAALDLLARCKEEIEYLHYVVSADKREIEYHKTELQNRGVEDEKECPQEAPEGSRNEKEV